MTSIGNSANNTTTSANTITLDLSQIKYDSIYNGTPSTVVNNGAMYPYYSPTYNTWNIQTNSIWATRVESPHVSNTDYQITVTMDDSSLEYVTRAELLKYICERRIIEENELVRTLYDRYQVAVKLARSDDDGDTGL